MAEDVDERWIVALEGVRSSDGRGFEDLTWEQEVPVRRLSELSLIVGRLTDFERFGHQIRARYRGAPIKGTISLELRSVKVIRESEDTLWVTGTICSAADIDNLTLFGDKIRRL